VLRGAADEVLGVIKNEGMKAPDKKVELEKLLNTLSSDKFHDITELSNQITDYSEDRQEGADTLDDEVGVAVVFDEDEEDLSDFEIKDEDSEEEEGEKEEQVDTFQSISHKVCLFVCCT
jgi:pre-mRNA-splicing helicase BRR2